MHKKNRFPCRVLIGNLKTRIHLEGLSTDFSIISKHLEEAVWECADWIPLAQDTDQWEDLVNIVMSFEVSWNVGSVLTSWATSLESIYCSFCAMLLIQYKLTFVIISCVCLFHSSTLASAVGPVFLLLLFYTYWYCSSDQ